MDSTEFSEKVMNFATLGGHAKIQAAKAEHQIAIDEYTRNQAVFSGLESAVNDKLNELGLLVTQSFKSVKRARQLIGQARLSPFSESANQVLPEGGIAALTPITKVDNLVADYSMSMSAVGGAGIGAASVAGAWSLVGLIGTASTGTAITTLSGAAATNATLAWFGGGALAAGGAGMAGGAMVIGGIVLAPAIGLAALISRSTLKKIQHSTGNVRYENGRVLQATAAARHGLAVIETRLALIAPLVETLDLELQRSKAILYPIWFWSFCKRWMRRLIGRPFYAAEEYEVLERLEAALSAYIDCYPPSNG